MLLCKIWALRIEGSEREDEPGWQLSNPLEVAPLSFCEGGPKQKRRPIGLAFVWMVRLGRRCSQRSFVTSSWLAVGSLLGDQRTVLRFTTSRSHYRGLRLATDLLTTDRLPALRSSAFSNWHTILKQRNTSTVWSVLETEDFDRFLFADCSAAKIVSGTIFSLFSCLIELLSFWWSSCHQIGVTSICILLEMLSLYKKRCLFISLTTWFVFYLFSFVSVSFEGIASFVRKFIAVTTPGFLIHFVTSCW